MDDNLATQFQSEPHEVRVVTNGELFALQVNSYLSVPIWYAPWKNKKIDNWWFIGGESAFKKYGLILDNRNPKLFATEKTALDWLESYNEKSLLDEKLNTWMIVDKTDQCSTEARE